MRVFIFDKGKLAVSPQPCADAQLVPAALPAFDPSEAHIDVLGIVTANLMGGLL